MNRPIVIGLRGRMGAGKTTIARAVQRRLNATSNVVALASMAGPLKQGLAVMGIEKEVSPDLYRLAAQRIGTDIIRDYDPDWWVKLARERINTLSGHRCRCILFDDIRFPNEEQLLDLAIFIQPTWPAPNTVAMSHTSEEYNITPGSALVVHNREGSLDDTINTVINIIKNAITTHEAPNAY